METLGQAQRRFAKMAAELVLYIYEQGYEVTLGDAFRDPRAFGVMGVQGPYGRGYSAHKQKLAIDLNLFKEGQYLASTKDHEVFGLWWESQGGTWGGRFGDGNHYSFEYRGVK
jgi:hypothetical protein